MRLMSGNNDIPARKWPGNAAPENPESGPRQPSSRGSAAAQCGKAMPFRTIYFVLPRLCLGGGVASGITATVSVRRSLTALCGGKAAMSND